jgi:hypothetical protein
MQKIKRGQETLGKPTVKIAGFQIWIHGREEFDEDWLRVTMHCGRGSSDIWVKSISALNIVYDIEPLISELEKLTKKKKGKMVFKFTEPYLSLELEVKSPQFQTNAEVEMKVKITPDPLFEEHKYIFGVSRKEVQSFLLELKKLAQSTQ